MPERRRASLGAVLPQDFRLDRVHVVIRAAEEIDVYTCQCLRPDEPERARRRLSSQKAGHVVYLFALINNLPVGTALLHWQSTTRVAEGASVSDLYVIPQLRGLRIGTHLLRACEALARQAGLHQISLAVNPEDNWRAKHLYERMGYREAGGERYLNATYTRVDENGREYLFQDWVVDMVKRL
ncbi:MAG: GNAT family N-acetyltransferase [Armatimonadota bacterium]|jgi:GNAT superfamily N-acetyltransferase|nr:GNAT family N-acetyltransferase [Armatimonadota bacterium]